MITLYSKATSNGRKASIMLEESGLDYTVRPMALEKKENLLCHMPLPSEEEDQEL